MSLLCFDADAVIIDLEDAVPADRKAEARAALRIEFTARPVLVRVNAIGTEWHDADVAAVNNLEPTAVMLPKAEAGYSLSAFGAKVRAPVVALVESARGLAEARSIAAHPRVSRLAFGSIDYAADVGCAHTRWALLAARSEIVLASRLSGLPGPLDGVTTSVDDAQAIAGDARHASELGFGGKLCIHPRQVGPIRNGLEPIYTLPATAIATGRAVTSRTGRDDRPIQTGNLPVFRVL